MGLNDQEQEILYAITRVSQHDPTKENDPSRPEFPPDNPQFPATPTVKISVPGFTNVWLKDGSKNPTGTESDRFAWEVIITYKDFLLAKKNGFIQKDLPQMSMITTGRGALAVQTLLNKFNLPDLKCLVDIDFDKQKLDSLKSIGCKIYTADLSKRPLHWKDILKLTDNIEGIELTSSDGLEPTTRFFDWMSYEIINQSPDYCFIPVGSNGHLYRNIVNISKIEVSHLKHDPRFSGNPRTLRQCNFIGSAVIDPKSKAQGLFRHHRQHVFLNEQWLHCYKLAGFCGQHSQIAVVKESFLEQAKELATSQGISCDYSGIAGLAMLLQMNGTIPKDKKILIVNTGNPKYPGLSTQDI